MGSKELNNLLQSYWKEKEIQNFQNISGGCINKCYVVTFSNNEKVFIKLNANKYKDNFIQERFNLEFLKEKSSLKVPNVLELLEIENWCILVLEYLENIPEDKEFHFNFGKGLAELHKKNTESFFGWYQNNYIGGLKQYNKKCNAWEEFFITQRLEPLVKECYNLNMLNKSDIRAFDNLYREIENIFPKEKSSLLHGDLWTGNRMHTKKGVAIFDPACYFGHREMDIAMLNLFGIVDELFYEGYSSIYPLEKNYRERMNICNLYPLLVHAILFGYNYIYDIRKTIKKFM